MAIDESILESVISGREKPTLRLYSWEPACLSLGFAQPISDVNLKELAENGWDLVRRPTGGRAILHYDEITYSVIGTEDDPSLAGGVLESYNRLSQALLSALINLGIQAKAHPTSTKQSNDQYLKNQNPVCFEVPSNYEITIKGKKLIGSAQARRKGGILQHGSIPLYGDLTRIIQVLQYPSVETQKEARARLSKRAITIEQALGHRIDPRDMIESLITAFKNILNLNLVKSELSVQELELSQVLINEKYTNPAWINRILSNSQE